MAQPSHLSLESGARDISVLLPSHVWVLSAPLSCPGLRPCSALPSPHVGPGCSTAGAWAQGLRSVAHGLALCVIRAVWPGPWALLTGLSHTERPPLRNEHSARLPGLLSGASLSPFLLLCEASSLSSGVSVLGCSNGPTDWVAYNNGAFLAPSCGGHTSGMRVSAGPLGEALPGLFQRPVSGL